MKHLLLIFALLVFGFTLSYAQNIDYDKEFATTNLDMSQHRAEDSTEISEYMKYLLHYKVKKKCGCWLLGKRIYAEQYFIKFNEKGTYFQTDNHDKILTKGEWAVWGSFVVLYYHDGGHSLIYTGVNDKGLILNEACSIYHKVDCK